MPGQERPVSARIPQRCTPGMGKIAGCAEKRIGPGRAHRPGKTPVTFRGPPGICERATAADGGAIVEQLSSRRRREGVIQLLEALVQLRPPGLLRGELLLQLTFARGERVFELPHGVAADSVLQRLELRRQV